MEDKCSLRKVLLKALNDKQLLILSHLQINRYADNTITSVINLMSNSLGIPVSTLKLNAKALRELGLIEFSRGSELKPARLTRFGRSIIDLIDSDGKL